MKKSPHKIHNAPEVAVEMEDEGMNAKSSPVGSIHVGPLAPSPVTDSLVVADRKPYYFAHAVTVEPIDDDDTMFMGIAVGCYCIVCCCFCLPLIVFTVLMVFLTIQEYN